MSAVEQGQWECFETYWALRIGEVEITIEPRPTYCDRGHWYAKVFGIWTDEADGFPRYFMDLQRAKDEMHEWLIWRLHQEARRP